MKISFIINGQYEIIDICDYVILPYSHIKSVSIACYVINGDCITYYVDTSTYIYGNSRMDRWVDKAMQINRDRILSQLI